MNRIISRLGFALLGFAWLGIAERSSAWERPPVKVNTVFKFDIEVKVGPDGMRPKAPWYVYFPADARMVPPPQLTPFPPFPQTFPPRPAPPAQQKTFHFGNLQPAPMTTQAWPNYATQRSGIEPAGYVPAQAPSYWYRNR